ncbi:ADP-ribose pyrophosphatase YjhB, NUDIX family [Evansella caseinilytica]|uniref:ADP-ribose pyrophosphatase YjhB, NUDIX family n=1 Tax=Evansella caseinilytica TaxID=1503961 RepID=A0A1H3HK11_9BACI|nr:NUDIX domain-containing protein [Evansella caseinilytica]SDY15700.1 ADP-ribose pyrophosphatase YjhB, NUDIX family [Evansella caseinilytica]
MYRTTHRIDDIRPGVAVVIFDEKKRVLLQKRADVGLWGIPSGHVEPGESVAEAAIREVKEEANLTVQLRKIVGIYSDPASQLFIYPSGKAIHFITTCFLAEIIGGELKYNHSESLDIQFFHVNELPRELLTMHPRWLEDALADNEAAFIR